MSRTLTNLMHAPAGRLASQRAVTANGNEAAAIAAQQFEGGNCPIHLSRAHIPAGQLAERTYEILSDGQAFVALMEAAEELLQRRECGCRPWSSEPAERAAVWNVPLRCAAEFEWQQNFHFLHQDPDAGPVLLFAFDPQEVYDMNIIGAKLARLVSRPVLVLSDGQTTDREREAIEVFANSCALRSVVEPGGGGAAGRAEHSRPQSAFSALDDLTQPRPRWTGEALAHLLDQLFAEFQALTGHRYRVVERHGGRAGETGWVVLNPPVELVKESVAGLRLDSGKPCILMPRLLNPFPAREMHSLLRTARHLAVFERGVPQEIVRFFAEQLGQLYADSNSALPVPLPVAVRSFNHVEAADAPMPGDTSWAFLETLRLGSALHA